MGAEVMHLRVVEFKRPKSGLILGGEEGRDSVGPGALRHLWGGNLATAHDLTVVRAILVYVVREQALVRRISKQPGACALGCCWLRRGRDSNSWYGMTRTSV